MRVAFVQNIQLEKYNLKISKPEEMIKIRKIKARQLTAMLPRIGLVVLKQYLPITPGLWVYMLT